MSSSLKGKLRNTLGSLRGSKEKSPRPTAAEAVVPPSSSLDRAVAQCSDPIVERVFKVVVIGAPGIGKTSMLRVASGKDFCANTNSTIGYDYFRIRQSNSVALQAYDTAGLERHNVHMAPFYCRGAHAVLLCYDVTDRRTFDALMKQYLPPVLEEVPRAMLVLVGTKSDLVREMSGSNAVPRDLALVEVERRSIPLFRETSAAEHPEVIRQMFADVASLLYNKHVPVVLKGLPPFKDDSPPLPPSTPVVVVAAAESTPIETTALRVVDSTSKTGGGGGCC